MPQRPTATYLIRSVVIALSLLVPGTSAVAQDITIAPRFKAGDTFAVELKHTREDSRQPAANATGTTTVEVRVVSSEAAGSVLVWVPGEARIDNAEIAQNPLLMAATNMLRGLELRLNLGRNGEMTGLANEPEVLERLRAATDVVMRGLMDALPPAERAAVDKVVGQLLSPAVLLASATRDAVMYFDLNGLSLAAGESVTVDVEQPNPFGGAPLPATLRVTMESATEESVVVTTATTYDAAALIRMARTLFEAAGQVPPAEEMAKLTLQLSDDARHEFDRRAGLMREVVVNRRIVSGPSSRSERWEIRLVRAPGR